MRVTSLRIRNFRSFVDSGVIELGPINVLIGANNAGKSSILRALHQMQVGLPESFEDVRIGANEATIDIHLDDLQGKQYPQKHAGRDMYYSVSLKTTDRRGGKRNGRIFKAEGEGSIQEGDLRFPGVDPDHFIVPYLSKRKAVSYGEDVREENAKRISSDISNLAARLSIVGNPGFPAYSVYSDACKSILGFLVTTIPSPNGQRPGSYLPDTSTISIEQMGEGVPNIVHFLVSVATSKNKLFLIEELENDLHPAALKALLELIAQSSSSNQFVISTHSNIVVRRLCSEPHSKLLKVSSAEALPATSAIELVAHAPQARISILQELGYSFADFDLWDGWLILEESSAERVIRDYLIPWFAPNLKRVRTLSAGGVSKVAPTFEEFSRIVLFTHLEPVYQGKTWVRVDNDKLGSELIEKLREKYSTWQPDRFQTLEYDSFEKFYPEFFSSEVSEILKIKDERLRREAKKSLLQKVLGWLDEDYDRAVKALSLSAATLIADLRTMEAQLLQ